MVAHVFTRELLFEDQLALVQAAEAVNLVLVLATDLDLVAPLLLGLGELWRGCVSVRSGQTEDWAWRLCHSLPCGAPRFRT